MLRLGWARRIFECVFLARVAGGHGRSL